MNNAGGWLFEQGPGCGLDRCQNVKLKTKKTMGTVRSYLVNLGLRHLTATQKVDKGRNHVRLLTDNPNFPELQAGLPEISEACDLLEKSVQEVMFNGGKIAVDLKNRREEELVELLTHLGRRVQVLSFGDKSKILSAGFEVRRKPRPITHLEAPQNLRAKISSFRGTIDLRWNGVPNTRIYQVFMTAGDPNDESGWELVGVTSRISHRVDNLKSGQFYSFRVNAVGARAESPASDVAQSMAA